MLSSGDAHVLLAAGHGLRRRAARHAAAHNPLCAFRDTVWWTDVQGVLRPLPNKNLLPIRPMLPRHAPFKTVKWASRTCSIMHVCKSTMNKLPSMFGGGSAMNVLRRQMEVIAHMRDVVTTSSICAMTAEACHW